MKRITAYLLLVSFVVILSPRTIWHQHDHHCSLEEVEKSATVVLEKDCFACDLSLSLFTVPSIFRFETNNQSVVPQPIQGTAEVKKAEFRSFSLRGPPHLS